MALLDRKIMDRVIVEIFQFIENSWSRFYIEQYFTTQLIRKIAWRKPYFAMAMTYGCIVLIKRLVGDFVDQCYISFVVTTKFFTSEVWLKYF